MPDTTRLGSWVGGFGRALCGALLFLSPAYAEERPVLHSGMEAPGVVEAWLESNEALKRHEVSLPSLRTEPGVWVSGSAKVTTCAGTPTGGGDLLQLRKSASGMVAYLRVPEAREALARLDLILTCLAEPIDASLAADLYRLRGYAEMLGKDKEAAATAFRKALSFAPELPWSEEHNPAFGSALLEDLRGEPTSAAVALEVLPVVEGAETTVGGRTPDLLGPGEHFVQLHGATTQSMWLRIQSGADTVSLVLPSLLGPDALQDWAEPPVQSLWRAVVQASPMGSAAVEVIADGHVHLLQAGATTWETTARLQNLGADDPRGRRRAALAWYGSAGLSILGGGALLGIATNAAAELEASARADRLSPDEAEATRTRINRNLLVGYGLIGAGVSVGGVGTLVLRRTAGAGGTMEWVGTW